MAKHDFQKSNLLNTIPFLDCTQHLPEVPGDEGGGCDIWGHRALQAAPLLPGDPLATSSLLAPSSGRMHFCPEACAHPRRLGSIALSPEDEGAPHAASLLATVRGLAQLRG